MNRQDHIRDERLLEALDIGNGAWSEEELQHLRGCSTCAAVLDEYRRLYPRLSHLTLEPLPADFADRVLQRLPQDGKKRKDSGMSLLWFGLGFMTIGVLVGLQAFYQLFSGLAADLLNLGASLGRETAHVRPFWRIFSPETLKLLLMIPLCFGLVGLLDWIIRRRHHSILRG